VNRVFIVRSMIRLVEASMKFSKILTVALVAGILSLNAQASERWAFFVE
jgi:hypothetical protein